MWSVYRNVKNVVVDVLCFQRDELLAELDESLRGCRTAFLQPMYNPPRSLVDRQSVKKADVESISIPVLSQEILLTRDLIDETCSLSDLFNLNEITALELVLTAEGQLSAHNGGISRGSLAVTLYFDAHRVLAEALKTIIRAYKSSRISSQSAPLSHEAFVTVDSFTADIWDSGFLKNALAFLTNFNVDEELMRVETARALGGRQHRRDILRLLTEIRNTYAECLMLWAAGNPFASKEIKQVLDHLVTVRLTPVKREGEVQDMPDLPLDHASIHLVMAILNSLEPFRTPGIDIDQVSGACEQDLLHPLFTEPGYLVSITSMLTPPSETVAAKTSPAVEGVYGLFELAWGIALRRTAQLRMDLRRRGQMAADSRENMDEEDLVASALRSNAIEFLSAAVLSSAFFAQEVNWVRRAHALLTELLIHFPQNARDIRLWDESVARRTGVDPAGFAVLLDALSRLYNVFGSPLHARLSLEYWWPAGETGSSAEGGALNVSLRRTSGDTENSRQATLFRFVYSASEFASAPVVFVPYVRMLRSLVGCQSSGNLCFNLLKTTSSSGGRLASLLTWDHFIGSLQQYLDHLQQALPMLAVGGGQPQQPLHLQHPHLYQNGGGDPHLTAWHQQQQQSAAAVQMEIQPGEVEALRIVVALITRVASLDPIARAAFVSNPKWRLVSTTIGLITCPLPMTMKADLFHLLAALSKTPSIGCDVWRAVLESRLFCFVENLPHTPASLVSQHQDIGLNTEMDKVEARAEEYPITQAFITLLTTLAPTLLASCPASVSQVTAPPRPVFSRLVNFTLETIFLKHTMRAYRRPTERWEIAASCVVLFEGLVRTFIDRMRAVAILASGAEVCSDAQLACFNWSTILHHTGGTTTTASNANLPMGWPFSDPGYQIVTQLLTNSSLISLLTGLLEVCLYRLLEYSSTPSACAMVRTSAAILRLFEQILPHEQVLVNLVRRAALVVPHLRIDSFWSQKSTAEVILPTLLSRLLVVTVNSRTGHADLLITIVRYCGLASDLPDHSASALNILYNVVCAVHPHEQVLAVFTSDKKSEQDLLHALVSCLPTAGEFETAETAKAPLFSDVWLFSAADDGDGDALHPSNSNTYLTPPHPALGVARACAAFPIMPADWDLGEARCELMAAFPRAGEKDVCGVDNLWLLRHLARGNISSIRSTMLQLILYALTKHPAPSIAHWLLGFRCNNARSIAVTTLQDAGVGGFPRTCLHFILDFIETAVVSLREISLADDLEGDAGSFVAQQWDAAVAWQILYHTMANPRTTGVPISRYLRGNHDLITRHLTTGLVGAHITAAPSSANAIATTTNPTLKALQAIVLNQCSWLLKMSAVELQSAASQRSYLTRLLGCLFKKNASGGGAGVGSSGNTSFNLGHDGSTSYFSVPIALAEQSIQGQTLVDLLAKMAPAEIMNGPQWILDQDQAESKLMEEIMLACEEPSLLIPSGDQASLGSGVINLTALRSRLAIFFPQDANDHADDGVVCAAGPSTLALLAERVCEWAGGRNSHRLALVAGKQACLEGWRQVAEVGMRMLHFLARVNPAALVAAGGAGSVAVNRYLYASSMSLLEPLLREVSAPKSAPAVLKVLASGSCLALTAFLQIFAAPSSADGLLCSQHLCGSTGILSVIRLTAMAILSSKPAQQRVRANYYGALCYALDVCQQLDQQTGFFDTGSLTKTAMGPTVTSQAVSILASPVDAAGCGVDSSSSSPFFLNVLFTDASSGHHPIIPISALALLCLLMKLDRSSGQILECFIRDGHLQTCIDSLEFDLSLLQEDLFRSATAAMAPSTPVDATAIFYVYQSKMSLLGLAASCPLGAKILVQSDLVDGILCRIEAFSESSFADVLSLAASTTPLPPMPISSSLSPPESSSYHSLAWLDSHEVSRHLLALVNREEEMVATAGLVGVTDPLVSSQLLSVSGSTMIGSTVTCCGQTPCWYDLIMPALSVAKSMAFTLGPSHVSVIQKVSKFIYTHSEALLTVQASSTAILETTVLTHDCFHALTAVEGDAAAKTTALPSDAKMRMEIRAILQWLRGEAALAHLLAFIMRARVPTSLGDPEDLPRELLRSKALRHVFAILPGLLEALQNRDNRRTTISTPGPESTRATYERNLITTLEVELLQLLVVTCQAAVSIEDEFGHFESPTSLKNLVFSASLSPGLSESGDTAIAEGVSAANAATGRPGLGLLIQLAFWAASRLHQLETVVKATTRHLPVDSLVSRDGGGVGPNKKARKKAEEAVGVGEKRDAASVPLDKVLRCLCGLPVSIACTGEDIPTESLRQVAIRIFSLWTPTSNQLLQTHSVFGMDVSQRTACLRRFIALGGALLQTQLSGLVDILEQSLYLLWRHLTSYVTNSKLAAEDLAHRNGAARTTAAGAAAAATSTSASHRPKRLTDLDRLQLLEQLPRKLNFDFLDSVTQVSKASYLSANDQLFVQAMSKRLERLGQTASRLASERKK